MKVIRYQMSTNRLTKEIPYTEPNLIIAQTEAYNGEYTIADDGQPEPPPTEQEQLRADVDFLLAMGGVL